MKIGSLLALALVVALMASLAGIIVPTAEATYLYADLGAIYDVYGVKIYNPDANALPIEISIYVSDSTDVWGAAETTTTILQDQGWQTITFDNTNGQYVKLEVVDWGSSETWKVSEYDLEVLTAGEIQDTVDSVASNLFLTFKIMSYGLIIIGILLIFGRSKGYI